MPRVPEDRPRHVVLERGGDEITVGDGGDISWEDTAALALQLRRQRMHRPKCDVPSTLPPEHLRVVLAVLRAFPGASVEDWRHEKDLATVQTFAEADRYGSPPAGRRASPDRRSGAHR